MSDLHTLIDRANAYARASGLAISTVSNKLFGHAQRLGEYASGRVSPTIRVLEQADRRLHELERALQDEAAHS